MPMDPAYKDLQLDAVEERGAGRVWQEMAKNPALPGDNIVPTFPDGIPAAVINRKEEITSKAIEARITQVLHRGKEG